MQKLVNVVALLSGLVSLSVVGGGAYLYLNKDAMIEDVRVKATEEITKAITEALPGMIDSAMPEMPEVTGGIVPESSQSIPNMTGGAIPF
jgi:hypothetical protein